jgi:integrase
MLRCHMRKPTSGRIYKRFNRDPATVSKIPHSLWTIRLKGRDYPTGTDDYKIAEKQLFRRIGELANERRRELQGAEGVLVADLLDMVRKGYQREGRSNLKTVDGEIRLHLGPKLGQRRAIEIGKADIDSYKDARLEEQASKATVNCELAVLMRGFRLAIDQGKLTSAPPIKKLMLNNVRTGFLGIDQYQALYNELPPYLKPVLCVAFHYGLRKGECLQLRINQVDLSQREIRLAEPGTTKNNQGRTASLYGEPLQCLTDWIHASSEAHPDCPWLFHDKGLPLQSFRKAWASACKRAGVPDLLFHDLRRSAVRSLTRAGIPRPVATRITGHKTESVYRRYDVVDATDLRLAGDLMDAFMRKQKGIESGSNQGSNF